MTYLIVRALEEGESAGVELPANEINDIIDGLRSATNSRTIVPRKRNACRVSLLWVACKRHGINHQIRPGTFSSSHTEQQKLRKIKKCIRNTALHLHKNKETGQKTFHSQKRGQENKTDNFHTTDGQV